MSDAPNKDVLDFLRAQFDRVHPKLDGLSEDTGDLKRRMTSLDSQVALLHVDFANQSLRIDRIDARLERIEKRLDPVDAPAA
jgi:hypothetical protein